MARMRLIRLTLLATAAAATAVAIKLLADRVPRVRRMQLMLTRHAEPKAVEAAEPVAEKRPRKKRAPAGERPAGRARLRRRSTPR